LGLHRSEISGLDNDEGDPRRKQIVLRLLQEVARVIEDLQVRDDESWGAVDYVNRLGARNEAGIGVSNPPALRGKRCFDAATACRANICAEILPSSTC
jgi:hypothetical protein